MPALASNVSIAAPRLAPSDPGAYPAPVGDTATDLIELLVGLGCLAAAVPALRTRRLLWLGAVLLLAGAAATVHAVVRLLG